MPIRLIIRFTTVLFPLWLLIPMTACEKNSTSGSSLARGRIGAAEIPVPELALTRWIESKDGERAEEVQLSDYNGKFLVVNFWATWCAPCIAEMPALERLYQKLSGKGLEVLAVNVEPEARRLAVKSWFQEKGLTFPLVFDHKMQTVQNFGISGFPETFFINQAGKVLVVKDPESGEHSERLISERPWDSPLYLKFVTELLEQNGTKALPQ